MDRHQIPEEETLWREQLANERTLLSWVRTGVHMIGAGILLHVVAGPLGLLRGNSASNPADFSLFGLSLVLFGALVELAAAVRFVRYRSAIARGEFTSSAPVYLLVAFGLVFLGIAFIGYAVIARA